jgi:hypothetical protein
MRQVLVSIATPIGIACVALAVSAATPAHGKRLHAPSQFKLGGGSPAPPSLLKNLVGPRPAAATQCRHCPTRLKVK